MPDGSPLEEGWYLMSVADLETELGRARDRRREGTSNAERLSTSEALGFRDAGNLPDVHGRTLRLVLRIDGEALAVKRLRFEPDYHDQPTWRKPGSKPINLVPLAGDHATERSRPPAAWWEQPDVAALEREWQETGAVAGLRIPAAYRSFVFKTIASLRASARDVNVETVAASLARWLSPRDAAEIRTALSDANR